MVEKILNKTIHLRYFAVLREQRGLSQETIKTKAVTAQELYEELINRYGIKFPPDLLKVAINDEFESWDTLLKENDTLVFIPPVAGG